MLFQSLAPVRYGGTSLDISFLAALLEHPQPELCGDFVCDLVYRAAAGFNGERRFAVVGAPPLMQFTKLLQSAKKWPLGRRFAGLPAATLPQLYYGCVQKNYRHARGFK